MQLSRRAATLRGHAERPRQLSPVLVKVSTSSPKPSNRRRSDVVHVPQVNVKTTGIEQVDIGLQILLALISIAASAVAVFVLWSHLTEPQQPA